MKIEDILRDNAGSYIGGVLSSISRTSFDPAKDTGAKPMRKIPGKITAYLRRDKIAQVYKCVFSNNRGIADYYIVRATDGTLFHVEY